jgi:transposase-like protein
MPRSVGRLVPGSFLVRRRWSAADARQVLERLGASGLSVREFATREGLQAQRLYRWRAQLLGARVAGSPAFMEIKPTVPAVIEVVLRSGCVLRVPDGFGEVTLRRLVAALDGPETEC